MVTTVSLWSDILNERDLYINPLYDPTDEVISLDLDYKEIIVWKEYFF